MTEDFSKRAGVALVTGGTGGIGSAVCRRLAARGAEVVFTYRRDQGRAASLLDELRGLHPGCSTTSLDLTDAERVSDVVDELGLHRGGLHTVVHAAGPHVPMRHLSTVSPGDLRDQLDNDVAAYFNLMSAAVPHLRSSRGAAVVVTTAATTRFPKRDGLSSGPKAAVEALARALACEEGRYGVRVNCVGPGMLDDGMAARLIASGDLDAHALEITRSNIPLRRFGHADDIAELASFLASDRAAFITGQKIDVDGGYGV